MALCSYGGCVLQMHEGVNAFNLVFTYSIVSLCYVTAEIQNCQSCTNSLIGPK